MGGTRMFCFLMVCVCRAAYAIPSVAAADPATADPAGPECIQRNATFDGIKPLTYATVTERGSTNTEAYLHHEYPTECAMDAECPAKAYLVPGDVVAVSKRCGLWSYVQFIGEKHVSYGWVRDQRLKTNVSLPKRADNTLSAPKQPVFELTKGRGTPVCEAYLQRLNQTEFTHPAFCGRPEDDRVPGFSTLGRVPVLDDQINRLYDLVGVILRPLDVADYESMNRNRGVFTGKPRASGFRWLGYVTQSSWKYEQPLDIDNDGKPHEVLIWNLDNPEHPGCGGYQGRVPTQIRAGQFAFILTPDGTTIDQLGTEETFGHPDGGYVIPPAVRPPGVTFLRSFRPIGTSYGVIHYRTVYYFDTFFDGDERLGDFEDKRKGKRALPDTLAVFQRSAGKTRQVCEYKVDD
jgi:hypothetical protein